MIQRTRPTTSAEQQAFPVLLLLSRFMSSSKMAAWSKENHRLQGRCGGADNRSREIFNWSLLASFPVREKYQHTLIDKCQ